MVHAVGSFGFADFPGRSYEAHGLFFPFLTVLSIVFDTFRALGSYIIFEILKNPEASADLFFCSILDPHTTSIGSLCLGLG